MSGRLQEKVGPGALGACSPCAHHDILSEDESICHLAASLPSCLDLPMGARPTVGGSAARSVYLQPLRAGSGCGFLQEVLSPPPSLIISQKKKKKRKATKNKTPCFSKASHWHGLACASLRRSSTAPGPRERAQHLRGAGSSAP